MAGQWNSDITEGPGNDPTFYVTLPVEQDQYQYIYSAAMDRNLSGSSTQSDQSSSSYQAQNYEELPLMSYDSPQSDFAPSSQLNQLSLGSATPSQESSESPFLFDIEKYGDPNIHWRMYYDFKVTKTEAYLQLKPGYLITESYPARVESEKIAPNGEKLHRCLDASCTAKPFTRHYDLERHFSIHQDDGKKIFCDYKKCPHKDPFRKDHCREHYREYHSEDLVKRVSPKSTKPKEGQKQPESVENFLAARIHNLDLAWWRCPKCIIRVQVDDSAYVCPGCRQACEPVRVTWRERARARKIPKDTKGAKGAKGKSVSACQCQNAWVVDDNSPTGWAPCPRCQPDGR